MRYSAPDKSPVALYTPLPDAEPRNGGKGAPAEALVWQDVVVAARRRWWLVLGVPAVLLVGTAIMVVREPPIYRATAVLRLGDARRAMTSGLEVAVEPARLMDPLLSQTQMLKSRALLGAVVDSLGIRLAPDYGDVRAALIDSVFVAPDAAADTLSLRFSATGVTVRGAADSTAAAYGQTLELRGGGAGGTVRFRVT